MEKLEGLFNSFIEKLNRVVSQAQKEASFMGSGAENG